ncbi:MAG TPA: hypothetical protein VFD89_04775 [Clostridia bacterium]|nr:hypothetical protein [Clostridia bacterium]
MNDISSMDLDGEIIRLTEELKSCQNSEKLLSISQDLDKAIRAYIHFLKMNKGIKPTNRPGKSVSRTVRPH